MFTETQVKRCADTGVCPFTPGTDAWYDTLGWHRVVSATDELANKINNTWLNGFYRGILCRENSITGKDSFQTTVLSIYLLVLRQETTRHDH